MTLEKLKASLAWWRKLSRRAPGMIAKRKRQIAARTPNPAKGIDVSVHQGVVDFAKVKAAGYEFAYVKASEGQDFTDSRFLANVKAARAVGLKVGAYHFLRPRPGRNGAVEALWFHARLKQVGLGKGDLIPVLDIESTTLSTAATAEYAKDAVDALARLIGRQPVVYTFPGFRSSWPASFAKCPLWVAHFGVANPTIPKPWTKAVAHQHSEKGSVPGVLGNCDLNRTANLRDLVA